MKSSPRTTMKRSVGLRGMTSTGAAISYDGGLSRIYASEMRGEMGEGRWEKLFVLLLCPVSLLPSPFSALFDRNLPEQIEIGEHLARSERDARQRILGQRDREAGLFAQALVEVLQHRAAAGDDDALVHDVGRQLGRRALQGDTDGLDDRGDRLAERLADLFVADDEGFRDAFDEVASLDLHRHLVVERERRADLHLDLLRRPFADEEVVLPFDVLNDRVVHLVAGD